MSEKLEQSVAEDIGDEVRYLISASGEKSLLRVLKDEEPSQLFELLNRRFGRVLIPNKQDPRI